MTIEGTVSPGYERLADTFARCFEDAPTMGAALSVRVDGKTVASLWGGMADERDGRKWTRTTPSVIYSCTKGVMSALVAQLVDEGRIDYDAPMARYWPEFAAGGKAGVTVAQALSHRAGLSAPRADLTLDQALDWNYATGLIAAQEPLWQPDTGFAYHSIVHGWLTGELIRRVTGKSAGRHLAELTAPLGLDLWVGLPPEVNNVSHQQASPEVASDWAAISNAHPDGSPDWQQRATTLGNVFPHGLATAQGAFNDPRVLAAEWPGAGGVATADALATFWSAAVAETEGMSPLLSAGVIERATRQLSTGPSVFGGEPPYHRWGIGFMLDCDARGFLTPKSFGHDGAGGQIGFADPEHRVGFGFVTNWLQPGAGRDRRGASLVEALQEIVLG